MKYFFLFLSSICSLGIFSQTWVPAGEGVPKLYAGGQLRADSASDKLYILGYFYFVDDLIYEWNGSIWDTLDYNDNVPFPGIAQDVITYNGQLIFSGTITDSSMPNPNALAVWDGQSFTPFTDNQPNASVNRMIVWNGDLIIGGSFDSVGNVPAHGVAKWDGQQWSAVGNDMDPGEWVEIRDLVIFKGKLYAAGMIAVPEYLHVTVLDQNKWKPVPGLTLDFGSFVEDLEVYNDMLFVCGQFHKSAGSVGNNVAGFDGKRWYDLGGGTDHFCRQMEVHDGYLYLSGNFNSVAGVPVSSFARWDGERWCNAGKANFDYPHILDMEVYHDTLYAFGSFREIDGDSVNGVAKFVGGTFADSCSAKININTGIVETTESPDIKLYPNPVSDILNIKTSGLIHSIEIFDVKGNKVSSLEETTFEITKVLVGGYPVGTYFIRIKTEETVEVRKFIKH